MPYIFMPEYNVELIKLNNNVHHVYVESVLQRGGERNVVYLRQNERGLPFTLRENYSEMGNLTSETYERDAMRIESDLQTISRLSYNGVNVCVPISPIINELDSIQRLSPKLAGYLKQRMNSVSLVL
jgi:hypothetical protein